VTNIGRKSTAIKYIQGLKQQSHFDGPGHREQNTVNHTVTRKSRKQNRRAYFVQYSPPLLAFVRMRRFQREREREKAKSISGAERAREEAGRRFQWVGCS